MVFSEDVKKFYDLVDFVVYVVNFYFEIIVLFLDYLKELFN